MKHPLLKNHPRRESGAVLIVALVMVLLISIVAFSGIRSSNLQEAMAGNMRDRNLAFQASESGLVAGESLVDYRVTPPLCTGVATCVRVVGQPASESVIYLDTEGFIARSRDSNVDLSGAGIEEAPRFMIEELTVFTPLDNSALEKGANFTRILPYRVTSMGSGMGAETSVILQSTYNRFATEE